MKHIGINVSPYVLVCDLLAPLSPLLWFANVALMTCRDCSDGFLTLGNSHGQYEKG